MNFVDIQKLKKFENLNYDGINYGNVIAARLYNEGLYEFIKLVVLGLLYHPSYSYVNKNSDIIVSKNFNSQKRKDYDFMYKTLLESLKEPNLLEFTRSFKPVLVLLNLFTFFQKYFKNNSLEIGIIDKIKVGLLENYYAKLKYSLIGLESSSRLYVSFCDSYLEENLAAQHFNQQGLTTATLQHGQYRVNNRGFEGTDSEAYLNFVSEYIFVWGEKTRQEFLKSGICSRRIIVTGALKPFTDNTKILGCKKVNSFIVFLNGESHIQSNKGILKIANEFAEEFNFDYVIKPHPMSPLGFYSKCTNKKFMGFVYDEYAIFNNYFALVHSSAVFLDLMVHRFPYFHLNDEYLDFVFKNDYNNFSNLSELSSLYHKLVVNNNYFTDKLKEEYKLFNEAANIVNAKLAYANAIRSILKNGENE